MTRRCFTLFSIGIWGSRAWSFTFMLSTFTWEMKTIRAVLVPNSFLNWTLNFSTWTTTEHFVLSFPSLSNAVLKVLFLSVSLTERKCLLQTATILRRKMLRYLLLCLMDWSIDPFPVVNRQLPTISSLTTVKTHCLWTQVQMPTLLTLLFSYSESATLHSLGIFEILQVPFEIDRGH